MKILKTAIALVIALSIPGAAWAQGAADSKACDNQKFAVVKKSKIGQTCFKDRTTSMIIAEIADPDYVPTVCLATIKKAPPSATTPTCAPLDFIDIGDEFRITDWNKKGLELEYRGTSSANVPELHIIPLAPEVLKITGDPDRIMAYSGSDAMHTWRVFFLASYYSNTKRYKTYRMQVFNVGDACIADYSVSPTNLTEVPCPTTATIGGPDAQGDEGGGTEPPPAK